MSEQELQSSISKYLFTSLTYKFLLAKIVRQSLRVLLSFSAIQFEHHRRLYRRKFPKTYVLYASPCLSANNNFRIVGRIVIKL
jgi:hypothetical protein